MKIIKKYAAIMANETKINREIKVDLTYGNVEGPYYSEEYPTTEFDTEDEAISYAYKKSQYQTWLIVPVIRFDNFS